MQVSKSDGIVEGYRSLASGTIVDPSSSMRRRDLEGRMIEFLSSWVVPDPTRRWILYGWQFIDRCALRGFIWVTKQVPCFLFKFQVTDRIFTSWHPKFGLYLLLFQSSYPHYISPLFLISPSPFSWTQCHYSWSFRTIGFFQVFIGWNVYLTLVILVKSLWAFIVSEWYFLSISWSDLYFLFCM